MCAKMTRAREQATEVRGQDRGACFRDRDVSKSVGGLERGRGLLETASRPRHRDRQTARDESANHLKIHLPPPRIWPQDATVRNARVRPRQPDGGRRDVLDHGGAQVQRLIGRCRQRDGRTRRAPGHRTRLHVHHVPCERL